jgi:hypothetical protein
VSGGVFLSADSTVNDVRVENCTFDVNGNETNFLAVIDISPDYPDASTNIVVRRNRIYDGQLPGKTSKCQRQYILLINCHYCRVENNHLTEGGRIKIGQPGEHLTVVGNTVEDANDNAISVVDVNNTVSFDIVIERNVIRRPLQIGIFVGADGDTLNRPLMTTNDVRVEANRVEGDWVQACIFARLPAHSKTIRILRNTCIKTGKGAQSSAGIRVKRTDDAVAASYDLRIEHNQLAGTSTELPALDAGIFFSEVHDEVKVSNNQIVNIGSRAMLFKGEVTHAKIVGNTIGAAEIQVWGHIQGQVQQPYALEGTGSVTP